MNARDVILALADAQPADLRSTCPWCGGSLEGHVFASWIDGKLQGLSQTRKIGRHEYMWLHSEDGCRVPALDRMTRPAAVRAL